MYLIIISKKFKYNIILKKGRSPKCFEYSILLFYSSHLYITFSSLINVCCFVQVLLLLFIKGINYFWHTYKLLQEIVLCTCCLHWRTSKYYLPRKMINKKWTQFVLKGLALAQIQNTSPKGKSKYLTKLSLQTTTPHHKLLGDFRVTF